MRGSRKQAPFISEKIIILFHVFLWWFFLLLFDNPGYSSPTQPFFFSLVFTIKHAIEEGIRDGRDKSFSFLVCII